jgi:hypothetical protein
MATIHHNFLPTEITQVLRVDITKGNKQFKHTNEWQKLFFLHSLVSIYIILFLQALRGERTPRGSYEKTTT